jgi:hypothetical protein
MTNWKRGENESVWHSLGVRLVFMAKSYGKPLKPCSGQLESRPFFEHGTSQLLSTTINH